MHSCMQLVSNPWQFDVMVLTNLYGTIVSNLICGLIGGPGLTAGANYGTKYALFEPGTRNVGMSLVNQNVANPVAVLSAGVELLKHIQLTKHADVRNIFLIPYFRGSGVALSEVVRHNL